MPENRRIRNGHPLLVVGMILLAAILVGLLLRKYSEREPLPQQPPPQSAPEQGVQTVTLFFASPDGGGLVRESRTIEPCSGLNECAEEVLTELINGPMGDFSHSLPETAMFHSVNLEGDILTVDFGRELPDGMAPGSDAEIAAVYSVVNSMSINFSQIKKVRFLVEGIQMDTLKGHIDLREPLTPEYSLEKGALPLSAPVPQQRRKP